MYSFQLNAAESGEVITKYSQHGPTGSCIGPHGVTNVTCESDVGVRMMSSSVMNAMTISDDYNACNITRFYYACNFTRFSPEASGPVPRESQEVDLGEEDGSEAGPDGDENVHAQVSGAPETLNI